MAIKKGLNPRFAEVGKIKIGGKGETKKTSGGKDFQIPVRYDHFVVTTTERTAGAGQAHHPPGIHRRPGA